MRNATVEMMLPGEMERKLDELLVFDARCIDAQTKRELLRLFPKLTHLRRAWREHFEKYGCLGCRDPQPMIAVATKLRQRGMGWKEIYDITHVQAASFVERKNFVAAVRRKLKRLDEVARNPLTRYGAGGLCDCCYQRLRRELRQTVSQMHEGRDAAEETAALTKRLDVAQWLCRSESTR